MRIRVYLVSSKNYKFSLYFSSFIIVYLNMTSSIGSKRPSSNSETSDSTKRRVSNIWDDVTLTHLNVILYSKSANLNFLQEKSFLQEKRFYGLSRLALLQYCGFVDTSTGRYLV